MQPADPFAAFARSWRLEQVEILPSTSDACIARAEAGEPAGLAILAERQTRARGSRGRSWVEPPAGNLALSVLLRPEGALHHTALWPLLAGLALHQALMESCPDAELMLKWPNDLLLDGRKLAGILVERGTGAGEANDWLVIGFGANLAARPDLTDRPTACLAEQGSPPAAIEVATRLLACLDAWQDTARQHGFDVIRKAWLMRAHPRGTRLAAQLDGTSREGRFAGLAADGALLLSLDGAERRVDTGEILMLGGS